MQQKLSKAILFATIAHDGQYDKSGRPYILHVMKVMHYLKSDDEELNCIAVLHDIVEDTSITLDQIRDDFGDRVADAVGLLTKKKGQTKEEYLAGILTNQDAMMVKRQDLRHNMDVRRLKGLSDKDFDRLKKYAHMFTVISEKLGIQKGYQ